MALLSLLLLILLWFFPQFLSVLQHLWVFLLICCHIHYMIQRPPLCSNSFEVWIISVFKGQSACTNCVPCYKVHARQSDRKSNPDFIPSYQGQPWYRYCTLYQHPVCVTCSSPLWLPVWWRCQWERWGSSQGKLHATLLTAGRWQL